MWDEPAAHRLLSEARIVRRLLQAYGTMGRAEEAKAYAEEQARCAPPKAPPSVKT
jgi:hypothetical protein